MPMLTCIRHTPTPSGNMHGMPLAVSLGEDNIENKVNTLDYETIELWEMLKNVGGISPKVEYRDLLFIALRDF